MDSQKLEIPKFKDPELQKIYTTLKLADEEYDNAKKVGFLGSVSGRLTDLITKLSQN